MRNEPLFFLLLYIADFHIYDINVDCCLIGKVDDYEGQTAAAGVLGNEYLPNYGGTNGGYSSENGDSPQYGGGTIDARPDYLFSKALQCFTDKHVSHSYPCKWWMFSLYLWYISPTRFWIALIQFEIQ